MRRLPLLAAVLLDAVLLAGFAAESRAIEMFTYFGDGSRIGLPSLEVPIEAYPGIPLRSDRLRARRRAMRSGSPVRVGPGTPIGGVTIRPMPTTAMPAPVVAPAPEPVAAPRPRPAPSEPENAASQPATP